MKFAAKDYRVTSRGGLRKIYSFLLKNFDFENIQILDFGCNTARFLDDFIDVVRSENYTGVDVLEEPIRIAKLRHPSASFILSKQFSEAYNQKGNKKRKHLSFGKQFDLILAHSVFSHYSLEETKREIAWLRRHLKRNGVLYFTVWETKQLLNVASATAKIKHLGKIPKPLTCAYILDYRKILFNLFKLSSLPKYELYSFFDAKLLESEIPGCTRLRKIDGRLSSQTIFSVQNY